MKFKTKAERDKFIEDNMGLVEYAIKNKFLFYDFDNNELTKDDARQIALTGLIRAVDKYEENRGYSFSSYAMKWICGSVFNATKEVKNGVRFGRKITHNKKKIDRYSEYMNDEEIAKKLDLTVDEVKKIRDINYTTLKLNSIVKKSDDEDLEIMDAIKGLQTHIDYDEKFRIENMLSILTDEERNMIIDYVFHDKTQTAMSKEYHYCQQIIGRKIRKALDKMRKHILDEVA